MLAHRSSRRGIGLIEVAVVIVILVIVAIIVLSQISAARETARGNTCRGILRGVATALFNHQTRQGTYPGYMNALATSDGQAQIDPQTGKPVPVSWVVMILPDVDNVPLYDQWRKPADAATLAELKVTPMPMFRCPSDTLKPPGPALSYVVNSGMPDAATATIDEQDPSRGVPRDWLANGVFFDQFSEHPLIKPDPQPRGPLVKVGFRDVKDPLNRTILMTENVDAGEYIFLGERDSARGWQAAEIRTGCIWRPGAFAGATTPPQMTPPTPSLHMNVGVGRGDGKSFNHCRPSSGHPESFNVAFVEQNIASLNDKISYFVYAKLMASDDAHVALAGTPRSTTVDDPAMNAMDPHRWLRTYPLNEADLSP